MNDFQDPFKDRRISKTRVNMAISDKAPLPKMTIYDQKHNWVTYGKWWVNFNEGGHWFTLWINLKSSMLFRLWFGPMLKGKVVCAVSIAIHNPWR